MKIKICWPFVRRIFFFSRANKIFFLQVKDAVNIRVTNSSKRMPALHSVSLCSDCRRKRTRPEAAEIIFFAFLKTYKTKMSIPPIDGLH